MDALRLRLFHLLVVLGLELDERGKYALVLKRIFVSQQHRVWLLVFVCVKQTEREREKERERKRERMLSTLSGPLQVADVGVGIALPQILEPEDLLRRDDSALGLLLSAGDLHQPGQKGAVANQWLPLARVPVEILQPRKAGARLTAEKNNHRLVLCRHEAQQEHVAAAASVAFQHILAEGRVGMEGDFLVLRTHEVGDDVRATGVAAAVAEPLAAGWVVAANNTGGVVDATIRTRMLRRWLGRALAFVFFIVFFVCLVA